MLEKIQMHWNRFEVSWDSYYNLAKDYFNKYGDLNIVADYETEDGVRLGAWLANQKGKYKKFKLSELQISLLEKIGIVWSCSDDSWDEGYRHAEEYFGANGNLDVKTASPARTASSLPPGSEIKEQATETASCLPRE